MSGFYVKTSLIKYCSNSIERNGYSISVHSNNQKYTCKDCRRTFYAYISAYFRNLIPLIGRTLNKFFKNGIINLKNISEFFNCSNSYTFTIVKKIIMAVNDSIEVKLA
ncbi:MAG: hypothetical protein ACTSRP_24280 [Candidatus Helarchaeota archaeon]